eukprot:PITA_16046
MGWHIHQMDVKTAFLNEVNEVEVYIEQPEGFEVFSSESHVCRLKRALYGLKQVPRAWYTRIDSYFTGLGFSKSEVDPNLYQIVVEGKLLIIVLYVDDLILMGDELLILSCKKDLATEFEMKDLGLLHYFLGLEIWHRSGGLFVSQGKYAREILEKFNMHGCKSVDTPLPGGWRKEDATSGEEVNATVYRQLVGSLIQEDEVKLCGFTDADWAGSPTDDIRYHHIRDCVQRRIMLLSYISTEDQDADILTKALTRSKFEYHRGRIGVADNPYLVEREF